MASMNSEVDVNCEDRTAVYLRYPHYKMAAYGNNISQRELSYILATTKV